jgi:hypothetical protein
MLAKPLFQSEGNLQESGNFSTAFMDNLVVWLIVSSNKVP